MKNQVRSARNLAVTRPLQYCQMKCTFKGKRWKPWIASALVLLLAGCKKDTIDPHQAILGKWEEFYLGNGEDLPPIKNPLGYREFLGDSVLLEYIYDTKTTYKRKYWIDSLLHLASLREDGFWITYDYECRFELDTLRLERRNSFPILYVSKYKKIN